MLNKFKRNVIVLSIFILLFCSFGANAASCQYCSGSSGWSGGDPDAGEPPWCTMYASSRTLGTCLDGTTGNCSENSKATLHYKVWDSYLPPVAEAVCYARLALCILGCDLDQNCMDGCGIPFADCLDDSTTCVLITDEYTDYMTGCV